ncbi:MAG: hypothetical protein J6F31_06330 [Oscillospiraceae bacterium]|nr:hypothetical protein [Oscillospiraceae bacterium]
MKTVKIDVTESFVSLTSAQTEELFARFLCYDGVIDTKHSWYGGLITAETTENSLYFTHDMPNGEWDSWQRITLRILEEENMLAGTENENAVTGDK